MFELAKRSVRLAVANVIFNTRWSERLCDAPSMYFVLQDLSTSALMMHAQPHCEKPQLFVSWMVVGSDLRMHANHE